MVGNFLCSDVFPDLPHHQRSHVVGLSELVETTRAVMEARNQHLGYSQSGLHIIYGHLVTSVISGHVWSHLAHLVTSGHVMPCMYVTPKVGVFVGHAQN